MTSTWQCPTAPVLKTTDLESMSKGHVFMSWIGRRCKEVLISAIWKATHYLPYFATLGTLFFFKWLFESQLSSDKNSLKVYARLQGNTMIIKFKQVLIKNPYLCNKHKLCSSSAEDCTYLNNARSQMNRGPTSTQALMVPAAEAEDRARCTMTFHASAYITATVLLTLHRLKQVMWLHLISTDFAFLLLDPYHTYIHMRACTRAQSLLYDPL